MHKWPILLTASLSSSLEFYDFAIYMSFFSVISSVFFANISIYNQSLAAFAVFAVGYLARPIGGIIFSHFGDTLGRKNTFINTILGISLPTLLIGFLPSYQQVHLLAPISLVILRVLQGISFGGEVPGALIYIAETYPAKHRAFFFSLVFVCLNIGNLLAMGLAYMLHTYLSQDNLISWGWRIPFILGGLMGIFIFYLRTKISESHVFQSIQQHKQLVKIPLLDIMSKHFLILIQGITMAALGAVIVILGNIYMPTYLALNFSYPPSVINKIHWINIIILCIATLGFGYLADKISWKKMLHIACTMLILLSYPCYKLLAINPISAGFSIIILSLVSALFISSYTALLVESFEAPVRYTGVSLSFNIGFALFGGTAPLIVNALMHYTHHLMAPAFYIIILSIIVMINRSKI